MKNLIIIICLFLILEALAQNKDLTVISYNVRYNSQSDGVNVWDNRKEWLTASIKFFEGDIVGAQEVTFTQLNDMADLLPNYQHIGEGRDGGEKGEFSPIFYVKDRFEVLDSDTFWLSETPGVLASKGWDAALPRIVTWAKFRDKKSEKNFYFFNTHFDHRGKEARNKSAGLISSKIESIAGNEPVILTGDFNTPPDSDPYSILKNSGMEDTAEKAVMSYTPGYTFNSWDLEASGDRYRIDYVFFKGEELLPLKYHVLDGQRGRRFISDHFPVIVKFKWINTAEE